MTLTKHHHTPRLLPKRDGNRRHTRERAPITASYANVPPGGNGNVARVNQRVELRNLRCVGSYWRIHRTRTGGEFTVYYYTFAGTDGRTYYYRGGYLVDKGCYIDCKATVKKVSRGGLDITFSRPTPLAPIDTPALL